MDLPPMTPPPLVPRLPTLANKDTESKEPIGESVLKVVFGLEWHLHAKDVSNNILKQTN